MECHSELKCNLSVQRSLRTSEKPLHPQARQNLNLQERLNPEKLNLLYADLHHEISQYAKDIPPKSSEDFKRQQTDSKPSEEDELVKYMSNLPSYLERGENLQEKVLNVGVLDWGRLEKWRYSHKSIPDVSSRCSPSGSNSSSSLSTDGSSAHSSSGYSRSPAPPRRRRPSLQYHLTASPIKGHSQDIKAFAGSIGKFQDRKPPESNILSGKEKFSRTDQPLYIPGIKQEENKRKSPDTKINQKSRFIPNTKIQDGEIKKRPEKLQLPNSNDIDQDVPGKLKTVLLLPRNLPQKHPSEVSERSDLTKLLGRPSAEAIRRSFSKRSKEIPGAELNSDIPHSCPLPCEVNIEQSHLKQSCTMDSQSVNFSSNTSNPMSRLAKVGISPPRSRNRGEKKSIIAHTNATNEVSKGLDVKVDEFTDEKVRSSSPFRRLNIGLGKMIKSSSLKEGLATQHKSSTNTSAKSASAKFVASACADTSEFDKLNARARSSPLRRLLEPLLKPKAANCNYFVEPSQRESTSRGRACKNTNGQLDSLTVHSGKSQLDTTVQALLRVVIKNGQPLFTFAVDNDNYILAATMKKLGTSRKGDYSLIYTFFTIHEVKKNSGWINQGGRSKGKSLDYIPNVVAQMKVSDSQFSNLMGQQCLDQFSLREFVLFSVDLRPLDQQSSDFQPNDELAAVVVKIPKSSNRSSIRDGCQSNNYNDMPEVGSEERLPGVRCYSNTTANIQKLPSVDEDRVSATVILPSGVHSLPSKGGPSSLIERWKSGGLCDCGGWDMGCKLQILANRDHISKKLCSSNSSMDKFELFCQEEVQGNQHLFSLAPFKDGIYSVEFKSSLSILQAFSICIAVLDSKKSCEPSEASHSFEEKSSGETVLVQSDRIRAHNRIEEVPARYVSYPPLSPVGRV